MKFAGTTNIDELLKKAERGKGLGKGGPAQQDAGTDTCICPNCGYEKKHDRGEPCINTKCPKCGTKMVGK